MPKKTLEESAERIWGMARDLASPRVSGTPLNSERAVRVIASVLNAYAVMHAETSVLVSEVMKRAVLEKTIKTLKAELKTLHHKPQHKKDGEAVAADSVLATSDSDS